MTLLNLEISQRLFRILLGVSLMAVGWWVAEGPIWAVSLRVVALYPLLTGLIGWCPVMSLWEQRRVQASHFIERGIEGGVEPSAVSGRGPEREEAERKREG